MSEQSSSSIKLVRCIMSKGNGENPVALGSDMIASFDSYESLESPFMAGKLLISDSKDFINTYPIQGGENIEIELKTSFDDAPVVYKFKVSDSFFTVITGIIIFYPICFVSNPVHAIIMGVTMHYTQYLFLTHKVYKGRQKSIPEQNSQNKYLSSIIIYSLLMSVLSLSGKSNNEILNILVIIPIVGQMLHFYLDSQLWKFSNPHNRENVLKYIK